MKPYHIKVQRTCVENGVLTIHANDYAHARAIAETWMTEPDKDQTPYEDVAGFDIIVTEEKIIDPKWVDMSVLRGDPSTHDAILCEFFTDREPWGESSAYDYLLDTQGEGEHTDYMTWGSEEWYVDCRPRLNHVNLVTKQCHTALHKAGFLTTLLSNVQDNLRAITIDGLRSGYEYP